MGQLNSPAVAAIGPAEHGHFTTRFESILSWAQKYSLFMYPFATACCAMEFMAVSSPRYDFPDLALRHRVFHQDKAICFG